MRKLLLDSHTLIWSQDDVSQLSPAASTALSDPSNELFLSLATVWELAIKVGKKRLPLSKPFRQWIETAIVNLELTLLPISLDHAEWQSQLPWHHKDPFDRMLIAQSLMEKYPVIGIDPLFDAYGVTRIWN